MAIVTEVHFAHEDGALAGTLAELPDLEATVVQETSTDPGRGVYFLRFEGVDPAAVREALSADHTVAEVRPVLDGDRRLLGIVFTDRTKLLAPRVTREDGFVLEARSSSAGGWCERWLFRHREGIHEVWRYAREEGFSFEVLELSSVPDAESAGSAELTAKQRETLVTAYECGYFDEPRESSLEELAGELGVSPSAVGGRIRRGMKSLIGSSVVVDDPES